MKQVAILVTSSFAYCFLTRQIKYLSKCEEVKNKKTRKNKNGGKKKKKRARTNNPQKFFTFKGIELISMMFVYFVSVPSET